MATRNFSYIPGAAQVKSGDPATLRSTSGTHFAYSEAVFPQSVNRSLFLQGAVWPSDLSASGNVIFRARFRKLSAGSGNFYANVYYGELTATSNRDTAPTSIGFQAIAAPASEGDEVEVDFTVTASTFTAQREITLQLQRDGTSGLDTFLGDISLVRMDIVFPFDVSVTGTSNIDFTINIDATTTNEAGDASLVMRDGDGTDIVRSVMSLDPANNRIEMFVQSDTTGNETFVSDKNTELHIGEAGGSASAGLDAFLYFNGTTAAPAASQAGIEYIGTDDELNIIDATTTRILDNLIVTSSLITSGLSDAISLGDASHAVKVPTLTTSERNALTPANGMVIYNSDTGQFEFYDTAWVAYTTGATGQILRSKREISNTTLVGSATLLNAEYWCVLKADISDTTVYLPGSPADGQEHSINALDVTNAVLVDANTVGGHTIRWSPGYDANTFSMGSQYDAIIVRFDNTTSKWYVV